MRPSIPAAEAQTTLNAEPAESAERITGKTHHETNLSNRLPDYQITQLLNDPIHRSAVSASAFIDAHSFTSSLTRSIALAPSF